MSCAGSAGWNIWVWTIGLGDSSFGWTWKVVFPSEKLWIQNFYWDRQLEKRRMEHCSLASFLLFYLLCCLWCNWNILNINTSCCLISYPHPSDSGREGRGVRGNIMREYIFLENQSWQVKHTNIVICVLIGLNEKIWILLSTFSLKCIFYSWMMLQLGRMEGS